MSCTMLQSTFSLTDAAAACAALDAAELAEARRLDIIEQSG